MAIDYVFIIIVKTFFVKSLQSPQWILLRDIYVE